MSTPLDGESVSDSNTSDAAVSGGGEARRRRRRGLGSIVLALLVVATAIVGVVLITAGAKQARPGAHPQPLPKKTFSVAPAAAVRLPHPKKLLKPQKGSIQKSCSDVSGGRPEVAIPSLCVYAPLVPTHFSDGSLIIPDDVHLVGIDTGSAATTAKVGTTVIAGHVDNLDQGDGNFFFLHNVKPGADVTVIDTSGHLTRWRVYAVKVVLKSKLPTDIFHTTGQRRLVLITCGGALLHYSGGNTYADNVLVYAAPTTAK